MKLKELIAKIEEKYPLSLAYAWDNSGLMIGDCDATIHRVLVCLEANDQVIQEAIEKKVDLIVTHHPFLFKKLSSVTTGSYKGRLIYELIKNQIGIYSMHTNFDIAKDGLNDYFMEKLSLNATGILEVTKKEQLFKLVVYVPETHEEIVREAIAKAGAGAYHNYSDCTYHLSGTGHFKPQEGANPYIGTLNALETVKEARIESTVCEKYVNQAIHAMLEVHPYEVPAYDVIALTNTGDEDGLGRVADLLHPVTLLELAEKIKKTLAMQAIRMVGNPTTKISRVAVVTGSGAEFVTAAKHAGAQVLITGDLKYHEAQDAVDAGMCVIDCNHFESENIFKEVMARYLKTFDGLEVFETDLNINPFTVI